MEVIYHPEAAAERRRLPARERGALDHAIEKLESVGDQLPYPHSSAVRGQDVSLRELRPRGGRSSWRALYRRVGDGIVIGAIGPEAQRDPRGFERAVALALTRIAAMIAEMGDAKSDGTDNERRHDCR